MFLFGKKEETCVQIPLQVKGRLYVSPMPFGPYDPGNALLKIYKNKKVQFAVMLVTDAELTRKAKKDLIKIYEKNGIEPIRFPIADYTSPELHAFSKVVDKVVGYLKAGANIAIHCNAGVGRTGVMSGCIVRDLLDMDAEDARIYIRKHMQTNITDEQRRLMARFKPLSLRIIEENEK